MTTIAVVFHSANGTTAKLADAVIAGVQSAPNTTALRMEIVGADIIDGRFRNSTFIDQLDQVDAMIFGSPTFMGSVSAQFKAFADATGEKWGEKAWADKFAAGFTIGTNLSGDQLHTLQYLQIFANQHGMLWASLDIPGGCDPEQRNRLGAQSGLIAHTENGQLYEVDLITAHYLGRRVAELAMRFGQRHHSAPTPAQPIKSRG